MRAPQARYKLRGTDSSPLIETTNNPPSFQGSSKPQPSSSPMAPSTIRFFKVMIGDFRSKLWIPPAFPRKLSGEKMGKRTVLTTYKGSWDVGICKYGLHFHFREGWEEFVANHDINVGDFLVFEHKGRMTFDVWIFDSTACEKILPNKSRRRPAATAARQAGCGINPHGKCIKLGSGSGLPPTASGKNNSTNHAKQSKKSTTRSAASSFSFTTTISPVNCVRSHPYLNIPKNFWRSKDDMIITADRMVTLRDELNRTWPVKLGLRSGEQQRLNLSTGWFEFQQANNLKIGDVCVFEIHPTSPEFPNPVLDVRVLPPRN